jgi:hypothetical protein
MEVTGADGRRGLSFITGYELDVTEKLDADLKLGCGPVTRLVRA